MFLLSFYLGTQHQRRTRAPFTLCFWTGRSITRLRWGRSRIFPSPTWPCWDPKPWWNFLRNPRDWGLCFRTSTSDKCPACGLGAWKLGFSDEPRLHWNYCIFGNFRDNLFFTFSHSLTQNIQYTDILFCIDCYKNFFELQKMTVVWEKKPFTPILKILWQTKLFGYEERRGKLDSIKYGYFIDFGISLN